MAARPSISLTKHHGLGNDFLVAVDPSRPLTSADAVAWCDRRTGIGADGLVMTTPVGPTSGPGSRRWRMVLWNSDGGRAETSGNGLRCLAQAVAEHLEHDARSDLDLIIETDAGTREATVRARPADAPSATANEDRVRVAMGKAVDGPAPSDRWSQLGLPVAHQVGADLGNPHLVAFLEGPGDGDGAGGPELPSLDEMARIGPAVEADHTGGLNVHVARVVGPDRIEMVIWERGAGVTMACGSGACAAAWAANRTGLVGATVTVDMPGGSALVELAGDEVVLSGPAVRVAEIRIDG